MHFDIQLDDNALDGISDDIIKSVENLVDSSLTLKIAELFAEMCDPYVPYLTGRLSKSATPSSGKVTYYTPYASNQYERLDENFTRDFHPLATGHWDEAMMETRGDEFYEKVRQIILDKIHNGV